MPVTYFNDSFFLNIFNFWDKYEGSGKSCLAIKGIGKTTIISYIDNIIPRTDLAIEYYAKIN